MTTEEMREPAADSAPRPPKPALVAALPDAKLDEMLKGSDTGSKRLDLHLENRAREEAELRKHEKDYSADRFQKKLDAIAVKYQPHCAEAFKPVADCDRIAPEQAAVHTRSARMARASFDRDPAKHAMIASDLRLRYASMPSVRLIEAAREAASTGNLAMGALIAEVVESRDDGPMKLRREQRAEVMWWLDRLDYGEHEVALTLAKMELNAARARIALFGGAGRDRIRLGLLEAKIAELEKAQAKRKAAAK